MAISSAELFKIGDAVPESGRYLCAPCGFVQYFEAGTNFTTCAACLAGTDLGPEGYKTPGKEFWQFIG